MGIELSELRADHDPTWIVVVIGHNRVLLKLDAARDLQHQLAQAIADAETTDAALRWRARSFANTEPPAMDTVDRDVYENSEESFFEVAEITPPPRGGKPV